MIGLDGEKMSKSKGNLVLVSTLMADGVDPMAIRYALMSHHYRDDQMWSAEVLEQAQSSLVRLRKALAMDTVYESADLIQIVIAGLADDLNTPAVIAAIEKWVEKTLQGATGGDSKAVRASLDALLGFAI
jgi:L-cysteine:1D-myo-inositol 2-amino-2-deoxy-alpha-D-glucopyranoside ligase